MRLATVLFALLTVVIISMGFAHASNAGPLSGPTPLCPSRKCAAVQ